MGTSQSSMACRPPQTSSSWKPRRAASSKRKLGYSEMSPPAQKAAPSPRNNTQRTSLRRCRLENISRNARHMSRDMALSLPGWDRVTSAIGPSMASKTCPVMQAFCSVQLGAGSLHHLRPLFDFGTDEAAKLRAGQVGELGALCGPHGLGLVGAAGL